MKILIYDDNENDIKHLINCIDIFFKERKISYHIDICRNNDDLFKIIKNYNLLFLDIKINKDNGIDLGLKLQNIQHDCKIIITTNYAKYAIDGYKINAERYFIKPIVQEEFNIEMNTVIKKYLKNSLGFYDENIGKTKLYIKDIIYIEFIDRKATIHKLKQYGFAYPYKAFIVNLEYISSINKNEITLINGTTIPLSRYYKKEFENTYTNYLHDIL